MNTPRLQGRLAAWAARVIAALQARLGTGGPGLTNTAFTTGIATLQATLEGNHRASLEFERARNDKSFTDVHGPQLAEMLHLLCDVTDDANLPAVHLVLLKSSKHNTYSALNSLFVDRARATSLPVDSSFAPVASPKLVEDVFRTYAPGSDGMTFGKGLSPFSIVCPGHVEFAEVQRIGVAARTLEAGASVSLADANALVTHDYRFPTDPMIAGEKLYGWSIVVDVFHGVNHPMALSIRAAVSLIVPMFHRLAATMGDQPAAGMELICRVMFDMQQDYFCWIRKITGRTPCAVPDFSVLIDLVGTYRSQCLSTLPAFWYLIPDCPQGRSVPSIQAPPAAPPAMRNPASSTPVVNAHPDARLLQRYKDGAFSNVTSMVGGRNLTYPKHGSKAVCLVWAFKGSCTANCKRADQHVRYGNATVTALHKFMDDCGVANAQP